jgi:hypothetical protein
MGKELPENQIEKGAGMAKNPFMIDYRNLDAVINLARFLTRKFNMDFFVIRDGDCFFVTTRKPKINLMWSSERSECA